MIKSIVILVLILVLAAAAFFSRPSEASFQQLVRAKMAADAGNVLEKILLEHTIGSYLDDCKYNDRYLWVDVTKDGQTIYTGVFSKWIERSAAKTEKAAS